MPDAETGIVGFYKSENRAIFPLDKMKRPRSLVQFLNKNPMKCTINHNFGYIVQKCSEREKTWLTPNIQNTLLNLHSYGYAHSIEVWQDEQIVGGLYGTANGGAFFGGSMFRTVPNAAKVALFFLIDHLKNHGYTLLDSRLINDFTKQLGAIEISNDEYMLRLKKSVSLQRSFV